MRIVVIGAEPLFRYQILDGIEWTVWIRAYGTVGKHLNIPLIRPKKRRRGSVPPGGGVLR